MKFNLRYLLSILKSDGNNDEQLRIFKKAIYSNAFLPETIVVAVVAKDAWKKNFE